MKNLSLNNKRYYQRHKKKILARQKKRREEHPEKVTAINKRWRRNNPDKALVISRRHYKKNPEKRRKQSKTWAKKNPFKVLARDHKRRFRLKGGGSYVAADIEELLRLQDYQCNNPYCQAELLFDGYHIDHIMPLVKGGRNDRQNLQLLCPPCNMRKHTKTNEEFLKLEKRRE